MTAVFILSQLFLPFLAVQPVKAADSTVTVPFSDSFGSTDANEVTNWADSDGSSSGVRIEGTSSPRAGSPTTGHVRIAEDGWICRTVDATGYENLSLTYYWRGDSDAESSDHGIVEVRTGGACNSGGGWTNVDSHNLDDTSWSNEISHNLSSSLDNQTFRLRFRADASQSNEEFRVDDVAVDGEQVAPPVEPAVNPALGQSCGLDIALVLDVSGSINDTELATMKTAFNGFVDAFLPATPTQFSVTDFSTTASVLQTFTSNATNIKSAINSADDNGYTNWEDALIKARGTFDPRPANPDLVVFASDGNPNTIGNGPGNNASPDGSLTAMNPAITAANNIKGDGTRIITFGIGDDLDTGNLEDISSADAVITSDFNDLAGDLAKLAQELCGGTITTTKLIDEDGNPQTTQDQTPAQGWEFDVDGSPSNPPAGSTDANGQTSAVEVEPGTYSVSETVQTGYEVIGASCNVGDDSVGTWNGGSAVTGISVGNSDIVSCTFINTQTPPKLIVEKVVEGGDKKPQDFSFQVDSGNPIAFESDGDNEVVVTPGDYQVTEVADSSYTTNYSDDCTGSIKAGETKTCTITNTVKKATLTVNKVVNNNWGGALVVDDFDLYVDFTGVDSGVSNEFNDGWHLVWEDQQDGYELDNVQGDCWKFIGDSAIVHLEVGVSYSCTLVNNDKPGSITVYKQVKNDNGGHKDAWDFDLYVDGKPVKNGDKNYLPVGEYTVSEDQLDGYELKYIKCYAKENHFASVDKLLHGDDRGWTRVDHPVYLQLDEHVVCIVKNDDIPPRIIVEKSTWDGGHNPSVSHEKFSFEVKNVHERWDKQYFSLDTNPYDDRYDSQQTLDMKKAGLFKISEKHEHGWTTFVKCYKAADDILRLDQSFNNNQYQGHDFPFAKPDNEKYEYVGIGETLYCHFYNVEEGKVKVTKFNDANENGRWDDGEDALPGWDITLTKQVKFFDHEWTKTTDEDGDVKFYGLLPNDPTHKVEWSKAFGHIKYKLGETVQEGWHQTNIYCDNEHRNHLPQIDLRQGFNSPSYDNPSDGHYVKVKPGETTHCYIGNVADAQLTIEKSNDSTDALLPGQTANYKIVVNNPAADSATLDNVSVYDLLPPGLSYVSGSWSAVSNVDGNQTGTTTPEPDYSTSDPAEWTLGMMTPGETITLTYTVKVDANTQPGVYTNVAWTLGYQCSEYGPVFEEYKPQDEEGLFNLDFNDNEEHEPREFPHVPFGCLEYGNPVLGNVGPLEESDQEFAILDSVVAFSGVYGDPFVESDLRVAAVLGESQTFVLAVTGAPAILMPVAGLTIMTIALGAGLSRRQKRRLLSRFGSFSRSATMSLLALVISVSMAVSASAASGFWKLTVTDFAEQTNANSIQVGWQVTTTDSSDDFAVQVIADGPGSNDYTSPVQNISGSKSGSVNVPLNVDGSYQITVSANITDNGDSTNLVGTSTNVQTVTKDSTAPTEVVYQGVKRDGDTYTLSFNATGADRIFIYASTSSSFTTDESNKIGEVDGDATSFVYNAPDSDQRYFALVAVDNAGNRSPVVGDSQNLTDGSTTAGNNGVVSDAAATDSNQASDNQGQEQGATDTADNSDTSDNSGTIVTIIVLAGIAALLYNYFVRKPNDLSN